MDFEYTLASGLVLFIIGIAFLWNRINFIKKGNKTLATVVKLEERLDSDNDKFYIPYFSFTTYNNREIIHEHYSTQWKSRWQKGKQVKIVYKQYFLDEYEILLLTFTNAFGLATAILTVGIVLLVAAGFIYWNVSGKAISYLIPISIILPVLTIKLWSNYFFDTLL